MEKKPCLLKHKIFDVVVLPFLLLPLCVFSLSFTHSLMHAEYASYTTDEYIDEQWAISQIELDKAWKICTGSENVKVGIIDSGIDGLHEDLVDNINTTLSTSVSPYYNTGLVDTVGHGTEVAGIVGASGDNEIGVSGVCWDTDLVSIKVANQNGGVDEDAIADAINYATLNNIPIINISIAGGYYNSDIDEAILFYPGLVVCAAGNWGVNLDDDFFNIHAYPACLVNYKIISVGNSTTSDAKATNSNYGMTSVDLFAPGTTIMTTTPGDYGCDSGTSFAAPMVSGVAALLLSIDPTLTTLQLKNAIMNGVDTISGLYYYCLSSGRLNAYKAALNVIPSIPVQPTPETYPSSISYSKILRLDCNNAHYTLSFSGPSHYRLTLYTNINDTPIFSSEYTDSNVHNVNFTCRQEETIFVKVDNLSGANGSFNANISNVTQHNYSRHMYFDSNYHRSICLCGAYIFEEHIYQLGNNNCIICTPLLLNGLSESNESDITVLSYD